MFEKRTDLALEVHELHGTDSGIEIKEETKEGILVTTATVKSGEGEKRSGKKAGNYITLDTGKIWQSDSSAFSNTAKALSEEIKKMIPEGKGCVLVIGLGNENITPDSLGPRAVDKLLVTRHIETLDIDFFQRAGLGSLASLSTGVLSQTGIETAEIIKSVCDAIKPKCVILIDALASRRMARLATTIQLSNNGISPGSGVSNHRTAIDKDFLGVEVISIGVPTVVDGVTLACDLLEERIKDQQALEDIIKKILSEEGQNSFVTPKENDVMIESNSKLIANAINCAIHKLSLEEINEYIGF